MIIGKGEEKKFSSRTDPEFHSILPSPEDATYTRTPTRNASKIDRTRRPPAEASDRALDTTSVSHAVILIRESWMRRDAYSLIEDL